MNSSFNGQGQGRRQWAMAPPLGAESPLRLFAALQTRMFYRGNLVGALANDEKSLQGLLRLEGAYRHPPSSNDEKFLRKVPPMTIGRPPWVSGAFLALAPPPFAIFQFQIRCWPRARNEGTMRCAVLSHSYKRDVHRLCLSFIFNQSLSCSQTMTSRSASSTSISFFGTGSLKFAAALIVMESWIHATHLLDHNLKSVLKGLCIYFLYLVTRNIILTIILAEIPPFKAFVASKP